MKHRTEVKQKKKLKSRQKIKTWIQIKNNCYSKGIYQCCNYLSRTYRNVPLPGFNEWNETIYNTNINNIQRFPQSPKFQETTSWSVSPTNFEISASSDKAETQSKRQRWGKSQTAVLVNSWKENFKLTESATANVLGLK